MKTLIISLLALTLTSKADIVVYPTVKAATNTCGNAAGCPGGYCGYVSYVFTLPKWGYLVDTNATSWSATDTNQPNTKVQLTGHSGDGNCNVTTVSPVGSPPYSTKYRFAIYFPPGTTIPTTTNYPLVLHGFLIP